MSRSTTGRLRERSPTRGRITPFERVTVRRKGKIRKIDMQNLCCVPGCGELMEPLCRLPCDESHQRQWLRVIGNPSLKTESYKVVYWYYRICRKHFTDEAFKNLKYKRLVNLNRFLNDTPTLHLPVITNEEITDMIDLNNSKPTSPNQIELLAEKQVEQSNHFIDIPTSSYNSNGHPCIEPLKTGAEPRTYCRKVKVKPEGNLEKKEPLKSHAEIGISIRTETFTCSSIKEESIELEAETELHKINEENVCIESDMFGENASLELQNYDHKIKTGVSKIKKEIIDLETEKKLHKIDEENLLSEKDSLKEESIDVETEKKLDKIDEENVCIESDQNASLKLLHYDHKTQTVKNKIKKESVDSLEIKEESINLKLDTELLKVDEESSIFGGHVSLKLQSYNENTRTIVKNLIDDILFNADNRMYDILFNAHNRMYD